ncbi:hypothetical protein [Nocardia bovistercoris]|uniref:Uncharacterized protein n=1 Tax=Nocardia bovistercoris TaxID=2785916 RepID=A0A931IH52_9NOCA|nr:hypothetical protein [Nocardia bovistercoris]MBH0779942.1 hypothetical protein [Nocardia bovistercoris]
MTTNSLAMYQLIALYDAAAHAAPVLPFSVHMAHEMMQLHLGCRAKHCARKAAAQQTLVEAGRMVPSSTKPR